MRKRHDIKEDIIEVDAEIIEEEGHEPVSFQQGLARYEESGWARGPQVVYSNIEFRSRGCGCPGCSCLGCLGIMFLFFLFLKWLF